MEPTPTLKQKLKRLNRQFKFDGNLAPELHALKANYPERVQAVQSVVAGIKGSVLEGLPCEIAYRKAKLMSDQEIALELDIPVRAVRKFSQVEGFNQLMNQFGPAIWGDLILQAQATIMLGLRHPDLREATSLAKWLLESTGQVASKSPMSVHDHKTIVLNGGGVPGQAQPAALPGVPIQSPVEELAEAMMKKLTDNSRKSSGPPPITISEA